MLVVDRLIGMPEEDAKKQVESHGMRWRVTSRDGEIFMVTADIRSDRVNLDIVEGTVTSAKVG